MTGKKIEKLIKELQSENDKNRYKSFRVLFPLSEKEPKKLYPFWEVLVSMLKKKEVSNKHYSINLISNLVAVDKQNKFEKIFKLFYGNLSHESPVVSAHVAGNSGKIVRAKPQLEEQITKLLLDEKIRKKTRYPDLMSSYIIKAFGEYFDQIKDKDKVVAFIKRQLDSSSPKTKKVAKEFLSKNKA